MNFRVVVEFAADICGDGSDGLDKIKDVHDENCQWFLSLAALTSDAAKDIVTGAGSGNGAEA